jgi:single-strand DNA-binding protein
MDTINTAKLLGNLGRDPRWSVLPNGATICSMVLATTGLAEDWQTGRQRMVKEWHRAVLVGILADSVRQRLGKGDRIYVEGRLQTRRWTDRRGIVQYTTEIVAESVQMFAKSRAGQVQLSIDSEMIAWVADYDRTLAREPAAARARATPIRDRAGMLPPFDC